MQAARQEIVQSVRPNACRMRETVYRSILATKERIAALEAKDVLNDSHQHSVIHISKMLENTCAKLKVYHYEIVAGVESDEAAIKEQEFFDEHQCKSMEFMDHLGDLLAKAQPSVPTPASTSDHLVDRQLDLLADFM